MINKNTKKFALEIVDDPSTRANFDLVAKQIQDLTNYLNKPNYQVSADSGETIISSAAPNFTQVAQLTCRITTKGNPVIAFLRGRKPDNDFTGGFIESVNTAAGIGAGGVIKLLRDGTVITVVATDLLVIQSAAGTPDRLSLGVPPSALFAFDDNLPAGAHEYQVWGATESLAATSTLNLGYMQLVVYELK